MSTVSSTGSIADIYKSIGGKSTTDGKDGAEEIQNRFLTLLVAQLQNQDPLNPTDNAQLTSQMSQISTVTGLEKLNATLGQMFSMYDQGQTMQAAAMIGKGVLVPGSNIALVEGVGVGGIELEAAAGNVTVTVKDASGKTVHTTNLGEHKGGSFAFVWDGSIDGDPVIDEDGNEVAPKAADGLYTFSVDASAGGEKVAASALQAGTVNAVVRGKEGFTLDLGLFGQVPFADVKQIL